MKQINKITWGGSVKKIKQVDVTMTGVWGGETKDEEIKKCLSGNSLVV